jgi:hypothetical protein
VSIEGIQQTGRQTMKVYKMGMVVSKHAITVYQQDSIQASPRNQLVDLPCSRRTRAAVFAFHHQTTWILASAIFDEEIQIDSTVSVPC